MKNFGKYFLLILAFLSISGGYAYGGTPAEIKEDKPMSSEDLKVASPFLWAFRENPLLEYLDLSENHFYGSISVIPHNFTGNLQQASGSLNPYFERDLRRVLFQQIFPKHFFL